MSEVSTFESTLQAVGNEFLVLTLNQQEFGIPILKVQEIRGFDRQTITRVANAPDCVLGIINLRGDIVPIVDLRIRFKQEQVSYGDQTVVIILNLDSVNVGVVVDSVADVVMLKNDQISSPPRLNERLNQHYLSGIGTLDDRMILLLDIETLMKDSAGDYVPA